MSPAIQALLAVGAIAAGTAVVFGWIAVTVRVCELFGGPLWLQLLIGTIPVWIVAYLAFYALFATA